jgi:hypothetical protein
VRISRPGLVLTSDLLDALSGERGGRGEPMGDARPDCGGNRGDRGDLTGMVENRGQLAAPETLRGPRLSVTLRESVNKPSAVRQLYQSISGLVCVPRARHVPTVKRKPEQESRVGARVRQCTTAPDWGIAASWNASRVGMHH